MNLKEKAISGIKWTGLATITFTVLQILQLLILSHLLSPWDFGVIAIANVIVTFIRSFSDLGINAAVIYYQTITEKQLGALYSLNILVGVILFILLIIFLPLILQLYKEPILFELLLVIGASLIINPFGSIFQVLFQRELQFNLIVIQELISNTLSFTVIIILAFIGFGVWALAIGQIVQSVIRSALLLWKGFEYFDIELNFRIADIKKYLSFGMFQLGERSINFLAERIDQILIGSLLGTVSLGYYYFAFNLVSQPILIVNPIFTKVAFPLLAKFQDQTEMLKKIYLKVINYISFIISPVYLGFIVLSGIGVPLIFGEKWRESIQLIQILSLVSLLRGFANPTGSILLAKGHADIGFYWNVFLLTLSVPAIYFFGKLGEAVGISIVLLAIQILLFYPNYHYLVKPFIGKCFRDYFYFLMKPFLISLVTSLFVISPIILNFKISDIYMFFLQLTIAVLGYVLVLFLIEKKTLLELKRLIIS